MKKIFVTLGALIFSIATLFAQNDLSVSNNSEREQETIMYKEGYRGDITLSWSTFKQFGISSSHGHSFGNGLYVGGGAGFGAEFTDGFDQSPDYVTPLFAELKYSFLNQCATPFVGVRLGEIIDISNEGLRLMFNPYVGVDFSRISIRVGYDFHGGMIGADEGEINHYITVGAGISF